MVPTLTLLFLILVEGYIVLASEIIAIRQIIPYVGSGTDTVSIIIAAVLMPLAFGYYAGGQFEPYKPWSRFRTVRGKLIRNIVIASIFLLPGLSYVTIHIFFITLIQNGIHNRLILTAIYSLVFLVIPVFLLGQTIPLVSNYFRRQSLSRVTGKILFFSTVGSFLGAVVTTLVMMSLLGVNITVIFILVLLLILALILGKSLNDPRVRPVYIVLALGLFFNSGVSMKSMDIVKANEYHNIQVRVEPDGHRHFSLNMNRSSSLGPHGERHRYIDFIERVFINPLFENLAAGEPEEKDILVIGAGGFTLGINDPLNNYIYVDIDPDLKAAAETYFLEEPLRENQTFVASPARAYLTRTDKTFDLIVLDAYSGGSTIPEHLVTLEFFQQVKAHLKPQGAVAANFITSPTFSSAFSRNVDNTFRAVFPHVSRHHVADINGWEKEAYSSNVVYLYWNRPEKEEDIIYTDNKNPVYLDRPKNLGIKKYIKTESPTKEIIAE